MADMLTSQYVLYVLIGSTAKQKMLLAHITNKCVVYLKYLLQVERIRKENLRLRAEQRTSNRSLCAFV